MNWQIFIKSLAVLTALPTLAFLVGSMLCAINARFGPRWAGAIGLEVFIIIVSLIVGMYGIEP